MLNNDIPLAWRKPDMLICGPTFPDDVNSQREKTDEHMEPAPARPDIRRDLVAILPRLRRFALALCRDESRVDGLVTLACEEAVLKSSSWRGDTRLEIRLFTGLRLIARKDAQRRKAGDEQTSARGRTPRTQPTHRLIIDTLPNDSAAVFLLCAVEGLTYREAASVMGSTEDHIAKSMFTARCALSALASNSEERRA
ncbi:sigma factor-like helix-turn-helix DNA-binding protein [Allorhizobium pseudoryzae]|uniref:sigma factor-like helix-turn-helix DNA-binding protein n=1 Tax=Allorhizobium pseudoryzae TaxID=379684 RepID=UPI003D0361A3